MDVLGIDPQTRAYRVRIAQPGGPVTGWVPETLVGAVRRHQDVYEWIARHEAKITAALQTLAAGHMPRPPYDQLRLAEDF